MKPKQVIHRQEASARIARQRNKEPERTEERRMKVDGLPDNPAYVKVGGGMTVSPQPYESIRIDISVSLPCGTSDREICKAKKRASAFLEEFIAEEYEKATGETL
jgi:hypothetical protein